MQTQQSIVVRKKVAVPTNHDVRINTFIAKTDRGRQLVQQRDQERQTRASTLHDQEMPGVASENPFWQSDAASGEISASDLL